MSLLLLSSSAAADDGEVTVLAEMTITARVQKPIAAINVTKIEPRLALTELRQSFADRIERALYRSPF